MLESTLRTISTRRVTAVRTRARSPNPTITGLEWLRAARVIGFLLNPASERPGPIPAVGRSKKLVP